MIARSAAADRGRPAALTPPPWLPRRARRGDEVALVDQRDRADRAEQRDAHTQDQDVVEADDERVVGRVLDLALQRGRCALDRLLRSARGDRLGELARTARLPDRRSSRLDSTRAWKTAPSAAIPVAIPTCRNVVLMPDAMPLCWGRTTPIAVDASGGLIRPTPMPATMKPARSAVHSESSATPCMSSSPPATSSRPPAMNQRTGRRSLRRPETAAAGRTTGATAAGSGARRRRPSSRARSAGRA